MYINFAIIQIKPGREADFEADIRGSEDSPMYSAPGWISNSCLKDNDNVGRYFYNSVWQSFKELRAYRETQGYSNVSKGMASSGLYLGPPDQVSASLIARKGHGLVFP